MRAWGSSQIHIRLPNGGCFSPIRLCLKGSLLFSAKDQGRASHFARFRPRLPGQISGCPEPPGALGAPGPPPRFAPPGLAPRFGPPVWPPDSAPRSNSMQCHAMQCEAMQSNAMQSNAKQCNAMQSNAKQSKAMQSAESARYWRYHNSAPVANVHSW